MEALLDAAAVSKGSRVLDVCTGAGYGAGLAVERGARATGIDFSAAQVKLARGHYPAATFQEGDGTALPFPDETFDSVVNSIGIPHFSDPDAAIREAFRLSLSMMPP
jgi:ubiquinone/menaquinone biosynthesis C-methylase UbiE